MFRACWTACPVVSATLRRRPNVIENAELWARGIVWRQLHFWLRTKLFRHFESMNEPVHLGLRDLSQAPKVVKLRIELVIRAIKPVAPLGSTMDPERSPNSIAEFVRAELILARKYLDSFRQAAAAFYRHFQATG